MNYKVTILNKETSKEVCQTFSKYESAQYFEAGIHFALELVKQGSSYKITLSDDRYREEGCTCPVKKNDGSPFDGVSYYCPLHGR